MSKATKTATGRAACLLPSERRALADGLRCIRAISLSLKKQRVLSQWRRQDGIKMHYLALRVNDAAFEIMTEAAARYVGETVAEFEREQIRAGIDGTFDLAKSETGRYELPMTRQELRAFEAVGGRASDFCEGLRISAALHAGGGVER